MGLLHSFSPVTWSPRSSTRSLLPSSGGTMTRAMTSPGSERNHENNSLRNKCLKFSPVFNIRFWSSCHGYIHYQGYSRLPFRSHSSWRYWKPGTLFTKPSQNDFARASFNTADVEKRSGEGMRAAILLAANELSLMTMKIILTPD